MSHFGRRIPPDFEHVSRWALAEAALPTPPANTEKSLGLPWWWKQHNQGSGGACVGWGESAMMSITNRFQRYQTTGQYVTYRYECQWLYKQAQLVDAFPDTPPGEGTTLNAGGRILKTQGHRRVQNGKVGPALLEHGISAYRWAVNHNEIRAAIFAGLAVAIGINWYNAFWAPYMMDGDRWVDIPAGNKVSGGHCVCLYRMSDKRQAFSLMNSWGASYPPVWLGYETMDRLLHEDGEAMVITDR